MSNNNLTDKIIRYHADEMAPDEQQAFEDQMSSDKKLQNLQADYEVAQSAVDALAYDELRSKLRQMTEPSQSSTRAANSGKTRFSFRLAIAATVLLLLVAGTYLWWPTPSTPAALASSFYEAPNFSLERSEQTNDDQRTALTTAWQREDYAYITQTLGGSDRLELTETQLLAHAYYQQQEWEKAIALFTTLIDQDDERYAPLARWYRALSYLQQDQTTKATADLELLRGSDNAALRAQAEDLLEAL
jgi:tetratricopeptide (TPR) repeat protein